ncbi:hypothetical protein [Thermococcus sp.]|uniref:hypothetical protein n=1 Tax=Thermococcus sp. TaxID=35749 RepID=UPI00262F8416|nr:hypothetical protein [Thermococcus sp.]
MYARDLDYYIFELETRGGRTTLELYFNGDRAVIRRGSIIWTFRLTPGNLLGITYVLSKFVEKTLGEEEIRTLLR